VQEKQLLKETLMFLEKISKSVSNKGFKEVWGEIILESDLF